MFPATLFFFLFLFHGIKAHSKQGKISNCGGSKLSYDAKQFDFNPYPLPLFKGFQVGDVVLAATEPIPLDELKQLSVSMDVEVEAMGIRLQLCKNGEKFSSFTPSWMNCTFNLCELFRNFCENLATKSEFSYAGKTLRLLKNDTLEYPVKGANIRSIEVRLMNDNKMYTCIHGEDIDVRWDDNIFN